jgi:CHAT domain-containing protein
VGERGEGKPAPEPPPAPSPEPSNGLAPPALRAAPLARLAGTAREVAAIREAFADEAFGDEERLAVLLRGEATEARLFALAPRARHLHLATHGLVDETGGASRSALALTLPAAAQAGDDGFLGMLDLLEHWRDRIPLCELVVLSACDTQRGDLQCDEGVFALPWGFHYAGCPSVVASLWSVDDASTAEMMADLYRRLLASGGRDRLAAFSAAKKALRARRPEPFYWAPFVFVGDPR